MIVASEATRKIIMQTVTVTPAVHALRDHLLTWFQAATVQSPFLLTVLAEPWANAARIALVLSCNRRSMSTTRHVRERLDGK